MEHGPFWHQLNKGGLEAILSSQSLLSTEAAYVAGGGEAVRAHVGGFARDSLYSSSPSKDVIEFVTSTAPRNGTPPWLAEWPMAAGQFLSIRVLKVYRQGGGVETYG